MRVIIQHQNHQASSSYGTAGVYSQMGHDRRLSSTRAKLQFFTLVVVVFFSLNKDEFVQARLQWRGRNLIFKGRGGQSSAEHAGENESSIISTTTKSYGVYDKTRLYDIETTATMKVVTKPTTTTKAAELIKPFEKVLIAVNRKTQDVHVGSLLTACTQLEQIMRNAGLSQIANDIAGNIKKIRNVYDQFPKDQRDSIAAIIQYEMDAGVHSDDRRHLKENSAAMGFIWLGRIINYQYDMFSHMLNHDDADPYEAARLAYERNLKPHLSWTLQKVCQAAMNMLKPVKKSMIYSRIGGFDYNNNNDFDVQGEEATKRDLRRVLGAWEPMLFRWKQIFAELDLVQKI
jgi:hypothetical protein